MGSNLLESLKFSLSMLAEQNASFNLHYLFNPFKIRVVTLALIDTNYFAQNCLKFAKMEMKYWESQHVQNI